MKQESERTNMIFYNYFTSNHWVYKFPNQIWDKSVQGFLTNDRTSKQTDKSSSVFYFFNEIVYKFFWGRGGGIVRKRRKDLHETLWLSEVISASGDEKLKNLLIFIRTLEAYYISPFSSDPHLCSRPLSPVIRTKDLANGEDGVRYPPFQFTDL